MEPVEDRIITVQFNADVHSSMQWNFRPQQMQVKVTTLAFLIDSYIEIFRGECSYAQRRFIWQHLQRVKRFEGNC